MSVGRMTAAGARTVRGSGAAVERVEDADLVGVLVAGGAPNASGRGGPPAAPPDGLGSGLGPAAGAGAATTRARRSSAGSARRRFPTNRLDSPVRRRLIRQAPLLVCPRKLPLCTTLSTERAGRPPAGPAGELLHHSWNWRASCSSLLSFSASPRESAELSCSTEPPSLWLQTDTGLLLFFGASWKAPDSAAAACAFLAD